MERKTVKKLKEMIKILNNAPVLEFNTKYLYNGKPVPRTTEILSKMIHSDSLMYWANSLGFKHKSYKNTLNEAAYIGTECHDSIDEFINTGEINDLFKYDSARNAYESFMKWWNDIHINGNTVEVLKNEFPLVCKYFGGTLDGLYKINNKIYLVDYKTSNHVTFKYCLQLASYRYMLREEHGIELDGCIVLQLSKNSIGYNEYVLDFSNPNHLTFIDECERAFLSLVYAYYNVVYIEDRYKQIWR